MTKRKTTIVTGASRGIGKAIAKEFASLGFNVALISRNYEELNETAQLLTAQNYQGGIYLPFECDVKEGGKIKEIFESINDAFGSIDVLVNNAGVNERCSLKPTKEVDWLANFEKNLAGWNEELAVNLTGSYICSYIAANYMLSQGSGAIINISSIKGIEPTSSPGYGASKAGVIKLTKDFAQFLAPHGVRVNCISPGFIDTGMTSELPEEKKQKYSSQIPAQRFGTIKEIAQAVVFLSSDQARYFVGENLNVNGGYLM